LAHRRRASAGGRVFDYRSPLDGLLLGTPAECQRAGAARKGARLSVNDTRRERKTRPGGAGEDVRCIFGRIFWQSGERLSLALTEVRGGRLRRLGDRVTSCSDQTHAIQVESVGNTENSYSVPNGIQDW